jgi:hypothetical protein
MISCVPIKLVGLAMPLESLPRSPSSLRKANSLALLSISYRAFQMGYQTSVMNSKSRAGDQGGLTHVPLASRKTHPECRTMLSGQPPQSRQQKLEVAKMRSSAHSLSHAAQSISKNNVQPWVCSPHSSGGTSLQDTTGQA